MYIPNRTLEDEPPDEILLIAEEVRELMAFLIAQGQQASHDELHYILFMMSELFWQRAF